MKVIALLLLGMLIVLLTALLGTLFFYCGWNWGIVPAINGTNPVGIVGAFWTSLGISAIGSMFKSSMTVNSKDD
jgi:hypothetical protein